MMLYEVLEKLNNHFTPASTSFFDYVIWTSDRHAKFLRTCYCKKAQPIKNYDLGEVKYVIVASQDDFASQLMKLTETGTPTKMQINFFDTIENLTPCKMWCKEVGFTHVQIFHL